MYSVRIHCEHGTNKNHVGTVTSSSVCIKEYERSVPLEFTVVYTYVHFSTERGGNSYTVTSSRNVLNEQTGNKS